ncbi:hypothetical protein MMC30_005427 [Trapelia coarctata]|nr:hypothetical protein [Trapelia coarctata]
MQASLHSTRAFLSKTGMKSFHRKQKSGDSATSMQPEPSAPLNTESTALKLPTVELIDVTEHRIPTPHDSSKTSSDNGDSEEAQSVVELPTKVSEPFEGLPEYRADRGSSQDLIDHDFLQKAFGITMGEAQGGKKSESPISVTAGDPMTPPESEDEAFEMEIPIHLAKDKRPELQVSIPASKSQLNGSKDLKLAGASGKLLATPNTISPPSTSTTTRSDKQFSGPTTARLSIVSPLSVVEMPKPRRPFSALSLEGMTAGVKSSTPPAKSATSNSSEDISEQDGKSSNFCHSPHSSMSSVNSDVASTKMTKNRERCNSTANTLEGGDVARRTPKVVRSNTSMSPSPMKSLKDKQSVASFKSTVSAVNKNKPLPPEPGQVSVRPLNLGHSPSRSSIMTNRQRVISSHGYNGDSQVYALNISRRGSKTAASLRSKYTPKDLDALDDVFQRTIPLHNQVALSYSSTSTPTLSQVTLALESQLDTIKEDTPNHSIVVASVSDPLQISRGPMRMEPSRRAPPPPGYRRPPSPPRSDSPVQDKVQDRPESQRRRFMKRSATSNHVITQMRSGESGHHRRASTAMAGSSSKANRILGKSGPPTPPRMERHGSEQSNWSSHDSPQMYTTTSSPARSADGSQTPESEQTSIPDAHFEEIRKRLELLSPKDDPSTTFHAFHNRHTSQAFEKVVILKHDRMEVLEEPFKAPARSSGMKVPEHIAELEAPGSSAPVELEDTQRPLPAELVASSPQPEKLETIEETLNENDVHPLERRGRIEVPAPKSTALSEKARSLHSERSVKCRSLASLAMSEIPDLYAGIPTPDNKSQRPSMTPEEVEQLISADAAERVLLRILESLENLQDLFAAAEVSRGFYRTFKRHELHLIKNALWCMSPAAWELREMSVPFAELENGAVDYKPSMYLRHYSRDLYTMVKLKSMILDHCKSFLRVETISGLAGETDRSPYIDDAFWRVWTFCRIFGCGKGREDDIVGQMDWLRGGVLAKQQITDTNTLALSDGVAMNSVLFNPPAGFGKGNAGGLTAEELYDMTEIWTCLGVLVRGYQGKRDQAREYGIFDGANIADGDVEKENATIEEWTYRILTLAPATILEVAAPSTPTQDTFAAARSQGLTSWTPPSQGASRSQFLKEAVSRVYEEKMSLRRRPSLSAASSFSALPQVASSPPQSTAPSSPDPALAARQRCAVHATEIRAKRQDPTYKDVPVSEERPMSNYPDVLARLDALNSSSTTPPPMPKIPSLASRLSFRRPKVTITSPSKSKLKNSPLTSTTSSPTASPSRKTGGILGLGRSSHSSERLPMSESLSSTEKLPLHPNSQPTPVIPSGPQVRDPVDVAVEKLIEMGFEEGKAKKALAETDSGNRIDFEKAVKMLMKERDRKKVMNRLDRMG